MSAANNLPPNLAWVLTKRHRTSKELAAVLLDVLDLLCQPSPDYEKFRDEVKPILDQVLHGKTMAP